MAQLMDPSPLSEQVLLQLQGGVKGRFARSFSVLQGCIDTLERYLQDHTNGIVQDDTEPLFESIYEQLGALEHLSDNAVDLLSGTVLHTPQALQPMDVAAFLQEFCRTANEELACREAEARITLELPPRPALYLPANEKLLTALLVNLVSNSVHARHDTVITLDCRAEGALRYTDTGPGPDPEVLAMLRSETVSMAVLRCGGLGLLVAVNCAQELGWRLQPGATEQAPFALELRLPSPAVPPQPALLHSAAGSKALHARLQRLLRRELALALR